MAGNIFLIRACAAKGFEASNEKNACLDFAPGTPHRRRTGLSSKRAMMDVMRNKFRIINHSFTPAWNC